MGSYQTLRNSIDAPREPTDGGTYLENAKNPFLCCVQMIEHSLESELTKIFAVQGRKVCIRKALCRPGLRGEEGNAIWEHDIFVLIRACCRNMMFSGSFLILPHPG